MNRREALRAMIAAPFVVSFAGHARAADWPTREVTVIVPTGGGGGADLASRALFAAVSAKLGVPMVVKNMPGAGGALALRELVNARPDGYTIGNMGVGSHVVLPQTTDLGFDPMTATTMIAQTFGVTFGIAVAANSPIKSIDELVAEGKKRRVNYSASLPSIVVAMFQLAAQTGANFNWVKAATGTEAVTQAAGGHVDAVIQSTTEMLPLLQSGALRLLASASEIRWPQYPDVKTLREFGYNAANVAFLGFAGPKDMPQDARQRLETAIGEAMKDPELGKQFVNFGVAPAYATGAQMKASLEGLQKSLVPVLTQAGVSRPK